MALQDANKKLVVITNVRHYEVAGQFYASGPYTLQIQPLADLFEKVLIAAPFQKGLPPRDCLSFANRNISILPQKETGGRTFKEKFSLFINVPRHVMELCRAMQKGEVIQVRCPCNLGLLGTILAPLFSKYIIANYAGQWIRFAGEPFSYRLQRFILRSWWWRNGLVLVYGGEPNQPKQVIPIFASTMTASQVQRGREAAGQKQLTLPVQILFVGRLVPAKGVDVLLRAASVLLKQKSSFKLSIVGEGHDRARLETMTKQLALGDNVTFVGPLPYEEVMSWYERAHVLVLPTRSEGFPKVLVEAMCYGVVCVATDIGLIPWMLKERGFVFPYGDVEALANQLRNIVENSADIQRLSKEASAWAQNYSIEGVRETLSRLFLERWNYSFLNEKDKDNLE
ncbi:glycosyltransferase family 4 protein [Nitrospira sp. MA-1]|nr:glycosyltransferase family 4 protein [Nitrospira sp. MA-1]